MSGEKWKQNNTTRLCIRFVNKLDRDIIDWLFQQPNKTDYLRGLIRKDMDSKELKSNK